MPTSLPKRPFRIPLQPPTRYRRSVPPSRQNLRTEKKLNNTPENPLKHLGDTLMTFFNLQVSKKVGNFVFVKRILWTLTAIVVGLLTFSCERDHVPQKARRTILVYMAARTGDFLQECAPRDINEMLCAEIPSDCHLLVFRSMIGNASDLVEISNGKIETLKVYEEGVIGASAETLKKVLADVRTFAPARENGVIFWSHSSGWKAAQRVAPLTRSFGYEGGRQIELPDLADALQTVPKLDFVFFDSCYMGCVEVAYEIRHAADYMVGSVCEVPGDGMPYDRTLPHLFAKNLTDGLQRAIDTNVDHYLNTPGEKCPSTLSLIDLSTMDALAAAAAPILASRSVPKEKFQYFSTSSSYKDYFVDLRQYMEQISTNDDATDAFNATLDRAVLHERHTQMIWGSLPILTCCGLSINPDPSSTAYGYQSLSWTIDTQRYNK